MKSHKDCVCNQGEQLLRVGRDVFVLKAIVEGAFLLLKSTITQEVFAVESKQKNLQPQSINSSLKSLPASINQFLANKKMNSLQVNCETVLFPFFQPFS